MINMHTVNTKVFELLRSNLPDVKHYTVTHAAPINTDHNLCPWVGVYRGDSTYTPRVISRNASGSKWRANPVIKIMVQAASGVSGAKAEQRLEEYIEDVMTVILGDPTIGGTVHMINEFNVSYSYNEADTQSVFYNMATIDITVESRT